VNHWKAINRTAWNRVNHIFEIELGIQRNFRQEWSQYVNHGYMPALFPDSLPFPAELERQFEKYTYSGNIRSTYRTKHNLQIISGLQSEIQNNRIDGRGFIIPAYDQLRLGAFLVMKQDIAANSMISGGLRYDFGRITTREYHDWFPSPADNGSDSVEVYVQRSAALSRRFPSLTWTLGYNLNLEHIIFKVNAAKSFRMPLAKELAANGVNYHHFSYEVGNPELSPETAYQLDAGLDWHTKSIALGISPFIGYFPNYIYLNPGYEHDRLYGGGNQVFNYTQSEVIRYGGEIHAHYQPVKSIRMGLIGEYIYSLQLSGEKEGFSLPFSPPASLLLHLKYSRVRLGHFHEPYASLDMRLVSPQGRIVPPEDPTPGYQVIHLGIGSMIKFGQQAVAISFQVQNLLNRKYFDHTSYYRLVNIPEPGRSFIVNISVPFSGQLMKQKSIKP
jgi:iron complex outermembrane receptor protein